METKVLNKAKKRNIERFGEDLMFLLAFNELTHHRSQIVSGLDLSYLNRVGDSCPYAFTELSIAMLSR